MAVPATNVFGPAVSADQVEAAVLATLKFWMTTYVHELERRTGRAPDSVAPVASWNETSEFAQDPGTRTPAVIVVSPGVDGLEKRGDGGYAAWWSIVVGVVATAKDRRSANALGKLYELAVRMILVHKASLKAANPTGFAQGFRLVDWGYDDAPPDFKQIATVATVTAAFLVENVVASGYGPPEPDPDPNPWGIVEEVDIDALATREGDTDQPDLMHLVSRRTP